MKTVLVCILGSFLSTSLLFAQTSAGADTAWRDKAGASIEKGLGYLTKQQNAEGWWSSADYPGLTGLIVQGFLSAPHTEHRKDEAARKGLDFIRKNAKADGGIYAGRLGNYNTSICLSTLLMAGDSHDTAIIDAAGRYLGGAQTKNSANPESDGGFGYESGGSGRQTRPDLDNTLFVLEALHRYQKTQTGTEHHADTGLNWQAAIDFVARCQQPQAGNKGAQAAAEDAGGFRYTPDGAGDGPVGEKAPRSYGTMTYAGVLSFIYADLKKDDPRVAAALDWIGRHYTLEENPGQGAQGLYYYYQLMAKGLTTAEVDQLTVQGRKVDWRRELSEKLIALQKPDGSWASENGRWMEKDPNLVTAYCVLALNFLYNSPETAGAAK